MKEMTGLPQAFCERMKKLLKEEYTAFVSCYEQERYYGLRYNPFKDSAKTFIEKMPFDLSKISWAKEGYYYQALQQPGKHVLHEIGSYYIQEPSAMAVVEILDPQPGERILDLCAAPGGKTTQIAGRMNASGILVSNEIIHERAKILSQNVERMGISNCVVCSESPERMAVLFPAFFDRILVDAPCSGEGMFRKDETARQEWSLSQVQMCADRQRGILEEAARMLKPGGVLVYSTCTFAPEENEGTISAFIHAHDDFIIEETPCDSAFLHGQPEWIPDPAVGIEYTMRLWPHKLKGEGHYIARLRRKGQPVELTGQEEEKVRFKGKKKGREKNRRERDDDRKLREAAEVFLTEELGIAPAWMESHRGTIMRFAQQLYLVPEEMIPMAGMKILRPGLCLLADKKNRFEPAHALALSLGEEDTERVRELTKEEAECYIHGESVSCKEEKGWILLIYSGYPVGFGKASGGQMKNHYPKGLRINR